MMKNIRNTLHKEILALGIPDGLLGEECLYIALSIICENPLHLCCISKALYFDIAEKMQTHPACVERNLRTFVSKLWNTDNHKYLDKISGYPLKKKPTNKEFLDMMLAYWYK